MAIKITFTKEMTIDLNTYYPQFSRKLKAAINDEVMALAGGERKRSVAIVGKPNGGEPLVWGDVGDGERLTHALREAKLSGRAPSRGAAQVHYRAMDRWFNGNSFLMGDAIKLLTKEFPDTHASTIITNLWRFRSIDVKRLEDSAK